MCTNIIITILLILVHIYIFDLKIELRKYFALHTFEIVFI